jgi:transketolase
MVNLVKERLEDIELTKAYSQQLIELAEHNPKIVDVEADVGNCIYGGDFCCRFPERSIDLGLCEQSLSSVSAGMSAVGMIPFCHTFAVFASRRMCDQNYISCAYAKNNVKIVASAPGISSGENGGTHHANEDIALVRPITDITILEPADSVAMRWAVKNAAEHFGVYYIRAERLKSNRVYEDESGFALARQISSGRKRRYADCGRQPDAERVPSCGGLSGKEWRRRARGRYFLPLSRSMSKRSCAAQRKRGRS